MQKEKKTVKKGGNTNDRYCDRGGEVGTKSGQVNSSRYATFQIKNKHKTELGTNFKNETNVSTIEIDDSPEQRGNAPRNNTDSS